MVRRERTYHRWPTRDDIIAKRERIGAAKHSIPPALSRQRRKCWNANLLAFQPRITCGTRLPGFNPDDSIGPSDPCGRNFAALSHFTGINADRLGQIGGAIITVTAAAFCAIGFQLCLCRGDDGA